MRTLFLFPIIFLFCLPSAFCQQIAYLDTNWKPVDDSAQAVYYTQTIMTDSVAGTVKTFEMNGYLRSEESFSHIRKNKRHGLSRNWSEDQKLKSEINYQHGKYHGSLKTYYENGELRRSDLFNNGELTEGKCFTSTGADTTYFEFEIMPMFPGGEQAMMKFLSKNIRYPKKGLKNKITGLVVSSFVVDTNGNIMSAEILKTLGPEFDGEVLRIISQMPPWTPGMQDGRKVKVRYNLPVRFSM